MSTAESDVPPPRWPYRVVKPWPDSCHHRAICKRNRTCWWGLADSLCVHQDRAIGDEIDCAAGNDWNYGWVG